MSISTMNNKKETWQRYSWLGWGVVIIAIYIWALTGLQFSGVQESAREVSFSILHGLTHPDFSYVYNGSGEDLVSLIIQTLAIAFLGTFVSALLSHSGLPGQIKTVGGTSGQQRENWFWYLSELFQKLSWRSCSLKLLARDLLRGF